MLKRENRSIDVTTIRLAIYCTISFIGILRLRVKSEIFWRPENHGSFSSGTLFNRLPKQ